MQEQSPGIGHNNPSAHAALADTVEQLAATANAWLSTVTEITDEEQAKRADDFKSRVAAELKAVETARVTEKAPHKAAAEAVDDLYRPLSTKLGTIKDLFQPLISKYLKKKDDERKAEAERKAREAEDAMRKAEEAQRASEAAAKAADGDIVGTVIEAAAAAKAADEAVATAQRIHDTRTNVKGNFAARATGLRNVYSADVQDYDKLLDHFKDHPKVRDVLDQLANEWARSPEARATPLPGVKLNVDQKAA